MNKNISTVIIAPMTTQSHFYPTRIPLKFIGKDVWIVLDQLLAVDRKRMIRKLGKIEQVIINQVKSIHLSFIYDNSGAWHQSCHKCKLSCQAPLVSGKIIS